MPRRAGQPPLTVERILDAALNLIDLHGLDALSMRRLAADLGVDAMAIYHHLPSKDALVHALVARLFAALPETPDTGDWQQRVEGWATTYRALARAHPNLVLRIVADPRAVDVAAQHANQSLLSALRDSGLDQADAEHAADLLVDYANGFVLGEASGAMHAPDVGFAFGLDVILAGLTRRTGRRSGT
jgi:AcrR family transcriptional regulator